MSLKNFPVIRIGERSIGNEHPCFIIAEISANHLQNFDKAVALIKAAQEAGADAVKLQTYTPDTMTIDCDKPWFCNTADDAPNSWKKTTLYDLYKTAYTPWEWHPKLKALAEALNIFLFSTPFDATAVSFLETMSVPCYKIASYEVIDIPLLKAVALTKKPVIISIGFAELFEVEEAVSTLKKYGAPYIAVLHCVTNYAETPLLDAMNLRTIIDVQRRFKVVSGFSDNNAGIEVPIAAVLAGASIIEKHFTLSRSDGGHDQRFSIEPHEFKKMVQGIRRVEKILGRVQYGPATETEKAYRKLRRSIFAVKNIQKGERFTMDNVRVIRPGFGLAPRDLDHILGKKAKMGVEYGTPIDWELISVE